MRLVEQNVELIPQEEGMEGVYKHIELCARTCYKSEDKIEEGSAEKFVNGLIKSKHFAMLEHATIYLKYESIHVEYVNTFYNRHCSSPYSKVRRIGNTVYVTTNYRVICEHGWQNDLKYMCSPTINHVKRYTFRITTSIGIGRELTRHRLFSFAQESTRYCNYNKDKFDKELTFIKPYWYNANTCEPYIVLFERTLRETEETYKAMEFVLTPQQAREVLPLCTKSELIMTGYLSDWKYFLELRLKETTGKVHPDMKVVSTMINNLLVKEGVV